MTDAEAIGRAVQEKKDIEGELRTLHIKADRYGESFYLLGQTLKGNPANVVFDDQSARLGTAVSHFSSKDFDIKEVTELVDKIRERENRLNDLSAKLA